jgi:hypothetical protein
MPLDMSIDFLSDTVDIFVNLFQAVRHNCVIFFVLFTSGLNKSDNDSERTRNKSDDYGRSHGHTP